MLEKEAILHAAILYEEYTQTIAEKYEQKWIKKYEQIQFNEKEIDVITRQTVPIKIVAFSADWCPDCQAAIPILAKLSRLNENIDLHIINRDQHEDLLDDYKIGGRSRVPLLLFMNEDYEEIERWVERSTFGYELLLEAKKEAASKQKDDHRPILRNKFKIHSEKLVEENKREILKKLYRTYLLVNGSAKLSRISLQSSH